MYLFLATKKVCCNRVWRAGGEGSGGCATPFQDRETSRSEHQQDRRSGLVGHAEGVEAIGGGGPLAGVVADVAVHLGQQFGDKGANLEFGPLDDALDGPIGAVTDGSGDGVSVGDSAGGEAEPDALDASCESEDGLDVLLRHALTVGAKEGRFKRRVRDTGWK
jgi:hypothetical protein